MQSCYGTVSGWHRLQALIGVADGCEAAGSPSSANWPLVHKTRRHQHHRAQIVGLDLSLCRAGAQNYGVLQHSQ